MRATLEGADWLGLASLAFVTLLALGGAASLPDGMALGWPGLVSTLAVLAAVAVLGAALGPGRPRVLLGLAVVPVLLLAAAFLPELRALSGPPLLALCLGGLALVLRVTGRVPPQWLLLPVLVTLYCGVAARVQQQVGADGDEPHYLMVAESLLRDGDLALEQDYTERRYAAFYYKPDLAPHFRVRGRDGQIYSLHAVGLSLLILPAYALGGYPGVSFFMALLLALLVREVRELVRALTGRDGLAEGIGWLAGLSPPLVPFAGLVFSEVPAALIVAVVLRRGLAPARLGPRAGIALGLALAFLPWLNIRYALLAALLLGYLFLARPPFRACLALVAPGLVSALVSLLYHWTLYGFFDPRLVYGRRPEFALATLREGLPGLLLDQEFGLLVYAPVLVLAGPGLAALLRRQPRAAAAAITLVLSVLAVAGTWHMWRGGFNPPARFLVPVAPALWLGVACWLARGPRAAHALLIGWGLWVGITGAWQPSLVHRDRDGTAPLFRTHSGAEEWTRLLPGYVLGNPDRDRLAVVWAALLAAAAFGARRTGSSAGAGSLALSIAALATATATASAMGLARTGGRDAVRLVGTTVLELPALRVRAHAVARWTPGALDWGALYEPHRHPDGVAVGERLPLRPGRYELRLSTRAIPGTLQAPGLLLRGEPEVRRTVPFSASEAGWTAEIEVPDAASAASLVVQGGSPFLLNEVSLLRR